MNKKEIVKLTSKIFDYVLALEDNDLNAFLTGEKELVLVEKSKKVEPKKSKEPEKIKSSSTNGIEKNSELEKIIKALDKLETREKATELLSDKTITVKILKEVAKAKKVHVLSRAKKDDIINKIVEGTVGARLKMKSLGED